MVHRMTLNRREFLVVTGSALLAPVPRALGGPADLGDTTAMYGLIGKMTAMPGQREALAAILLDMSGGMPGCLSYVVANDPTSSDALWVTEVWDSQASHAASLQLESVRAAIARGRPLIAGFSDRVETVPLGGIGLAR